jgi:hypothetical protein
MTLRRRLFWLWIVASCAWFVSWLIFILATCEFRHFPSNEPSNLYLWQCRFSEWMIQVRFFTVWDYGSIILYAVSVPLAVLILGLGTLWAIDGFKGSTTSN